MYVCVCVGGGERERERELVRAGIFAGVSYHLTCICCMGSYIHTHIHVYTYKCGVLYPFVLQGCEDTPDVFSCKSLSAKEQLTIGLFGGK